MKRVVTNVSKILCSIFLKERCSINAANRAKAKMSHKTGSMSFVAMRHEIVREYIIIIILLIIVYFFLIFIYFGTILVTKRA